MPAKFLYFKKSGVRESNHEKKKQMNWLPLDHFQQI